jgi:hypothetical protein
MAPILSTNHLAALLKTSPARLKEIAGNLKPHYRREFLRVGDKVRELRIPKDELKRIQRRILAAILLGIEVDPCAHGGVTGHSTRSNARQHSGHGVVATCDVRSFFPCVRPTQVFRMFRHRFGYGRDVASILTRLVTYGAELPQGAPTSTAIANLLLKHPVDGPLTRLSAGKNCYTRFVDDLTFSGIDPTTLIQEAGQQLSRLGLRLHRKKGALGSKSKLRIARNSEPQIVTGLTVNAKEGPSVPKQRRDAIRSEIHKLRNIPTTGARSKKIASIRGKIAYVKQFNPGSAARLARSLEAYFDQET